MLKIVLILAATLILTPCRLPAPVSAAVEFAPGVGADADQPVISSGLDLQGRFPHGAVIPPDLS